MRRIGLLLLIVLTAPALAQELPREPILRLEPGMHSAPIRRIDIDPEGQFLVTGSIDKTVRIWALDDGRPLATLRVPIGEGHVGRVVGVAMSPDGERIAAAGWGPREGDNSIYIFERAGGRIVQRIDGLPNAINHLAFSPDGRHLVACLGGSNGIRVYETENFREAGADRDYGSDSYGAAFDREGWLVTSSYDAQIRLYGPDFRLIDSKKAPGDARPFGVAFSPDGAQVAVGYYNSTRVEVLDGRTLAPLFEADTTGVDNHYLIAVAWSADGRFLYAGGGWSRGETTYVRRWADGGRGAYEDVALSGSTIMDLRPLADGGLAFGTADPSLGVLDPDGQILWRKDPAQPDFWNQYDRPAASADGARIVFDFEQYGNSPAAFDIAARRLTPDPEPDPALTTPRTEAPGLEIVDWKDQFTPTLNGARLPLKQYERSRSLAIAPDGARFLLGTEWSLRLCDRNGEQLWQKPAPGVAWGVNITGNGQLAIAAFGDGTIRWFRLEDGAELLAFFPHADRERWVVWTPQGYYMASPGGEELIGWHVNRGLDTPEFYTAGRFRDRFHRPDVIALVLEELDVEKALARANEEAQVEAVAPPPTAAPADIADALPPTVEIISPGSGERFATDDVIVKFRVRSQGETPPFVTAHLDGQVAEIVSLLQAGEVTDTMLVTLAGRVEDPEVVLSLIAKDEHGASDPAEVRLEIAGAGKSGPRTAARSRRRGQHLRQPSRPAAALRRQGRGRSLAPAGEAEGRAVPLGRDATSAGGRRHPPERQLGVAVAQAGSKSR